MNACVNLNLIEGQISRCKATQTDFDVPESAGKKSQNSWDFSYIYSLLQMHAHQSVFAQKYRSLLARSKD